MIGRDDITGLVLCGGRGARMGGVDKGLQLWHGRPLAQNALARLAPQVGSAALNANRHPERYAAMGVTVWPDTLADQPGPLAGLLAGLERCGTTWLLTVPCDAPLFPHDLVQRLVQAIERHASPAAIAVTTGPGGERPQPVFCLVHRDTRPALLAFLEAGGRAVGHWTSTLQRAEARFDDEMAFANVNTLDELRQLEARHG